VRWFASAFIVLSLAAVAQQSPPPSPTPTVTSQAEQGQARGEKGVTKPDNQPAKNPTPAIKQPNPEIAVRYDQHFGQENKDRPSIDGPSRAIAFFTFGLLVLAGFQWYAMHRQAKVMEKQAVLMRGQLKEMKTTSTDTHILAEQAEKTATAAKKSADVAGDQLSAFANAARARLAVMDISHLPIDFLYTPNVVNVRIINRGHTAAIDVRMSGQPAITPKGQPINWDTLESAGTNALDDFESVAIIGAGLPGTLLVELYAMSNEEVVAMRCGEAELYIRGTAIYSDVFQSQRHAFEFTALYHSSHERWVVARETET
jgi:hypothetical protein